MPAINTTDLINAKLDADTIAGVATSTALTVTDRLGNTKNTLAGMSAAISASTAAIAASAAAVQGGLGYLPPVAYAAGISLTLAAQTVGYSGQTYAPILSALPFTTSGTFETAEFRLLQGVSGADLAAPSGAGMIGNGYGTSSSGVSLPVNPLAVFSRSSPIPINSAITGGAMVTDASVDYSAQFQAVINYLRDYGGGKIILPPNTRIRAVNLSIFSGLEIEGYDWTTSIEVPAGQQGIYVNPGSAGTVNVADNLKNIALRNFKIKGTVATAGFSQFVHLVGFSAVSYSEIVGMCIEGFQGDGINFGSGYVAGIERHNYRNRIIGGRIDGVNNDNRNGISIIDSDGMEIDGVEFRNCTRPNMPGPIDMEPDGYSYPILKNISVRNCKFDNCGGNVGHIGVILPAAVIADFENLTIENNVAKNSLHTSAFIAFNTYRTTTEASPSNNLRILNNKATGGIGSLALYSGKDIIVSGNVFTDHTQGAFLGYTAITNAVRDIVLTDNSFVRQASAGGSGVNVFKAARLTLVRNKLIDCGNGVAGSSNGIIFQPGASSYVSFDANAISSPTGKTLVAITCDAAHALTPSTNKFYKNETNGLPVFFSAEDSDTLETIYFPVITGSSVAGSGSYTTQYGVYKRIGKTIFFRVKLAVSAGHTGSGMIQVGLPTLAAPANDNQERVITLLVSGVSSTGGQVAVLNPALIVSGLGALWCQSTGTGVIAQILIPAGAFVVYASGSYQAA